MTATSLSGSARRRGIPARLLALPDEVNVPALPEDREWTPWAVRWWETVHASAVATEWTPDDVMLAERGLTLTDDFARLDDLRLKLAVSHELRQIESSLGLSPRARAQMRVEVERGEDAQRRRTSRQVAESPRPDDLAKRRELVSRIEKAKG